MELKLTQAQLKRIHPDLEVHLNGKYFEVFAKLFTSVSKLTIVIPKEFRNSSDNNCISCIYGAKRGNIFVLSKSLLYIPRPIIHIKFKDIMRVEFHRVTKNINNKGFDFEILTKEGKSYFFAGVDKSDSNLIMDMFFENKILVTTAKDDQNDDDINEFIKSQSNESAYVEDGFVIKDHESVGHIEEEKEFTMEELERKTKKKIEVESLIN